MQSQPQLCWVGLILSSLLGYLIFAEVPPDSVLIGAVIVLLRVAIAARKEGRNRLN